MLALSDDRTIAAALAHHARASRRVRLEVPALYGDRELARAIEASAGARPRVVRVDANPRSGRVLIEYARDAPVWRELERIARRPAIVPVRAGGGATARAARHAATIEAIAAPLAGRANDRPARRP